MSAAGHDRYPWMDRPEQEDRDDETWCQRCERFVPFGFDALCPVCGDDDEEET